MLLPNRFLLLVMIDKFLFLLPQPLGMHVMELFHTLIIKFGFDWSVFCLHDSGTDTTDGIVRAFCCGIKPFLCRYTAFLCLLDCFKQFLQQRYTVSLAQKRCFVGNETVFLILLTIEPNYTNKCEIINFAMTTQKASLDSNDRLSRVK